jgi:hypothetical protein
VRTCDMLHEKDVYSGADWEDWLREQEVCIIE